MRRKARVVGMVALLAACCGGRSTTDPLLVATSIGNSEGGVPGGGNNGSSSGGRGGGSSGSGTGGSSGSGRGGSSGSRSAASSSSGSSSGGGGESAPPNGGSGTGGGDGTTPGPAPDGGGGGDNAGQPQGLAPIPCGRTTCDPIVQECCVQAVGGGGLGTAQSCVRKNTCAMGAPLSCTTSANCLDTQVCCITTATSRSSASCQALCGAGTVQLCGPNDFCPVGYSCASGALGLSGCVLRGVDGG
jgi:hypothetical protein